MNSYMPSIEKAINWINTQMLTFDNGYYGIYERIRIDKHIRTNWSRPDCNAEYLRVLHTYDKMTGEIRCRKIEENILAWLERTQDREELSVWKGSMPFYLIDGYISDGEVSASLYQNDNGKVMIAMCQLFESTKEERYLEIARGLGEYWINTQQPDGTYGIDDGKNMQVCRRGPCFVQWLVIGFYQLYHITEDMRYLESAELGMEYLISLLQEDGRIDTSYKLIKMEDWRPVSSEITIMLLTLSNAYQVTEKPIYFQKLHQVGEYLLSMQQESGAILNCKDTDPEASLQNNKDLCDLVYTQNFAIQALIAAYEVTGEKKYLDSAYRLGDFLVSIQCNEESKLWDGGWRGSYNVVTKEWDGRADQNNLIDEGGMYSVYTGWCCTNIVYGLELLEQYRTK
ncbi:MAG: beta-L-arabinofuranosidase domain-containing protein [Mobilitalea sp.]